MRGCSGNNVPSFLRTFLDALFRSGLTLELGLSLVVLAGTNGWSPLPPNLSVDHDIGRALEATWRPVVGVDDAVFDDGVFDVFGSAEVEAFPKLASLLDMSDDDTANAYAFGRTSASNVSAVCWNAFREIPGSKKESVFFCDELSDVFSEVLPGTLPSVSLSDIVGGGVTIETTFGLTLGDFESGYNRSLRYFFYDEGVSLLWLESIVKKREPKKRERRRA